MCEPLDASFNPLDKCECGCDCRYNYQCWVDFDNEESICECPKDVTIVDKTVCKDIYYYVLTADISDNIHDYKFNETPKEVLDRWRCLEIIKDTFMETSSSHSQTTADKFKNLVRTVTDRIIKICGTHQNLQYKMTEPRPNLKLFYIYPDGKDIEDKYMFCAMYPMSY